MRRREWLLLAVLMLAGCNDDSTKPYFEFAGGGFIFNYRNADAFYGFVANPVRPTPEGAVIEVAFELPGEANSHVIQEPARPGQLQYSFRTPTLRGIEKGHEYQAVLRVLDKDGKELARYAKSFHTDLDQKSLPDKPLVVGPAYQPNPALPPPGPVAN